jgi:hypothetical protein
MFGRDPYRNTLTFQPRGEFEMSLEHAIDVMDELYLRRTEANNAGYDLAVAWHDGRAQIRDMAHGGGNDHRIHITVLNHNNGRHYHVPVCWDGTWIVDDVEGITR